MVVIDKEAVVLAVEISVEVPVVVTDEVMVDESEVVRVVLAVEVAVEVAVVDPLEVTVFVSVVEIVEISVEVAVEVSVLVTLDDTVLVCVVTEQDSKLPLSNESTISFNVEAVFAQSVLSTSVPSRLQESTPALSRNLLNLVTAMFKPRATFSQDDTEFRPRKLFAPRHSKEVKLLSLQTLRTPLRTRSCRAQSLVSRSELIARKLSPVTAFVIQCILPAIAVVMVVLAVEVSDDDAVELCEVVAVFISHPLKLPA